MAQRSKFIGASSRNELWAPQEVAYYFCLNEGLNQWLFEVTSQREGPGFGADRHQWRMNQN
jgi:hypothetical protein